MPNIESLSEVQCVRGALGLHVFQYAGLHELEMYSRKHNLEIHGVPEDNDEDLDEVVIKLAEIVGVEADEDDIDIVHRLPSRSKGPRPVIVKFRSHKVKSQLYMARRNLRGVTSFDSSLNGAKAVYINENLTSTRRKLFGEVRKRAKLNIGTTVGPRTEKSSCAELKEKEQLKSISSRIWKTCTLKHDASRGISFIQETHTTPDSQREWEELFKGDIVMAHGTHNSKGRAILLGNKLEYKIKSKVSDPKGRYIVHLVEIQGTDFLLINTYQKRPGRNT
ncbi:hypothetical protein QZH41_009453 [Actinostola sp. cb2023]|nr:hypothetical protein QZH41_009453 [Actinostola sp. cb2023]